MAESEKEEKVEDVYKFQGKTPPPAKEYLRRSPRVQYSEVLQESASAAAEESGDNYDYSIIDTFIGMQGGDSIENILARVSALKTD